jgi:hypothetical protein
MAVITLTISFRIIPRYFIILHVVGHLKNIFLKKYKMKLVIDISSCTVHTL